MTTKDDFSFGVIPFYKDQSGEIKFCFVKHRAGHIAFPKGHKEEGESDLETAKRELREEVGIQEVNILEGKEFIENYKYIEGDMEINKTVKFFLGEVKNMDTKVSGGFEHEIQEILWMNYREAMGKVTYYVTRNLLEKVAKDLGII